MNSKGLTTLAKVGIVIAVIIVAGIIGGVYYYYAQLARPKEPIVIGGVMPLSAPGAYFFGQDMQIGMQFAVEDVNAEGGVLGRPLEIVFQDTKRDPATGTSAMLALITENKVVAVAGEYHSSVALAEIEVAHQYGIPFIVVDSWASAIREKGYPEVFSIAASNDLVMRHLQSFVIEALKAKSIAVIAETTDYGTEFAPLLEQTLKAADPTIQFTALYVDNTATDYTGVLLQLKASPPDIVFDAVTGPSEYLIIKQAAEIGLAPTSKTLLYDYPTAAQSPDVWEAVGPSAVYTLYVVAPGNVPGILSDIGLSLLEKYQQKYDKYPTYDVMLGYDSILIIKDAIESAGSTESSAIISALQTGSFQGTTKGTIQFAKETGVFFQQWLETPVLTAQLTEVNQPADKHAIIWPPTYATAPVQYP